MAEDFFIYLKYKASDTKKIIVIVSEKHPVYTTAVKGEKK